MNTFPPANRHLYPQSIDTFVAIRRQLTHQISDLSQYPQPFFGEYILKLLEGFPRPTAHMKLADLMREVQLPGDRSVYGQDIGDDHTHPRWLNDGFKPAPHRLLVMFVDITHCYRLAFPKVDCHQHRVLFSPSQHISSIQPQHSRRLPLVSPPEFLLLRLCIPPHHHRT